MGEDDNKHAQPELSGMWEEADLTGGETDTEPKVDIAVAATDRETRKPGVRGTEWIIPDCGCGPATTYRKPEEVEMHE